MVLSSLANVEGALRMNPSQQGARVVRSLAMLFWPTTVWLDSPLLPVRGREDDIDAPERIIERDLISLGAKKVATGFSVESTGCGLLTLAAIIFEWLVNDAIEVEFRRSCSSDRVHQSVVLGRSP